ncbi:hypothetical protein CEXT_337221 [Caerostris extrusa]|uniref:Uncharacterized protein n=1 Tax=Caerostris extrusa TaxID=172846 RepID=A0AAV4NJ89_CAEEX|nr:hypothetical protein CEXT_337221 [Caerostris extrusa]
MASWWNSKSTLGQGFSVYATVGRFESAYNGEFEALRIALIQFQCRTEQFFSADRGMAEEPDDDELEAYLRSSLSDRRRSRWGEGSLCAGGPPPSSPRAWRASTDAGSHPSPRLPETSGKAIVIFQNVRSLAQDFRSAVEGVVPRAWEGVEGGRERVCQRLPLTTTMNPPSNDNSPETLRFCLLLKILRSMMQAIPLKQTNHFFCKQ